MKNLIFILMLIFVSVSCQKDNIQPEDDEVIQPLSDPEVAGVIKVIQLPNSQPIQVFITDSSGYELQGNVNDCRAFYDLPSIDTKYYFLDASENYKHILTIEIQSHSGEKIAIIQNSFLGYFLAQEEMETHCGSSDDPFNFFVGIHK